MKRKLFVFLFLGMCFVSIYTIQKTYALFESQKELEINSPLAKWVIKVNDETLGGEENLIIDNLTWNENEYVKDGKVAPEMDGYFDLVIDPTGTEVSVRYDLTFDFSNLNNENLKVETIKNLENFKLTKTGENTYTGVIPLADVEAGTPHTIRANIVWFHTEENNENDSILGTSEESLIEIPVNIEVSQYLGEEILEYVEPEPEPNPEPVPSEGA